MSSSLPHAWLANLYSYGNKPDQNLGRYEPNRSLCRITLKSSQQLMDKFLIVDGLRAHDGLRRTFIDLGCGRGLVCAAAMAQVACLHRVIGWDIDEAEVQWARYNVAAAATETEGALCKAKVRFECANALEFCAARDAVFRPEGSSPPGSPKELSYNESVWIYAFWADWGLETRRQIARHLFLEDAAHWSVFACSDGDLLEWNTLAQGNDRVYEMLNEAYQLAGQLAVHLTGSGRQHTIYFYVKRR